MLSRYKEIQDYVFGKSDRVPAGLIGAGGLNAQGAIDVYRGAHEARLTEALGNSYDRVLSYLGDEKFHKLCRDFILSHPSKMWSLNDYGEDFPEFISQQESCKEEAFIADLAKMNWAFNDVFHAPNEKSLSSEALAANPPNADTVFSFKRNVFCLDSQSAIYQIWEACAERKSLDFEWWNPESIVMCKEENKILTTKVHPLFSTLICNIKQNKALGEIVEEMSHAHQIEGFENTISLLFQQLSSTKVLSDSQ